MWMGMLDPKDLENQLREALKECASLREENERLKKLLGLRPRNLAPIPKPIVSDPAAAYTSASQITNDSPTEAQIALFRSLFRGREDAYPVRWEGRKGNSGYSPACANEWKRPLCRKPMVKCSDCENRDLKAVTDEVIHGHLLGKHTVRMRHSNPIPTSGYFYQQLKKSGWRKWKPLSRRLPETEPSLASGSVWPMNNGMGSCGKTDYPKPRGISRRLSCPSVPSSNQFPNVWLRVTFSNQPGKSQDPGGISLEWIDAYL